MNLLSWVLFGLIVGIIANSLEHEHTSKSLPSAIILGVGGGVAGGFVATLLFGGLSVSGFDLFSFLIAAACSLFVLSLSRAMRVE